jgi:hypothetical protein
MFSQNISHKEAFGGRLDEGFATAKFQGREFNYEFLGQYTKLLGDVSLNANVGANKYTRNFTGVGGSTVGGLSSPAFYSLAGSIARPNIFSSIQNKQTRSLYGLVSLGYKDIYFIDGSIRNDVSSALPVNNNSYWYPSVSASFVFSELLKWKPLSFGKLRAGYAIAGSDLEPYQTGSSFNVGTVYTGATSTINTLSVPDRLNNPNIEPSFAKSFETGVELGFLNGRTGIDFTYHRQKNENLSMYPVQVGFPQL